MNPKNLVQTCFLYVPRGAKNTNCKQGRLCDEIILYELWVASATHNSYNKFYFFATVSSTLYTQGMLQ